MRRLPNVTLVCIDCVQYGKAIESIRKSRMEIEPARTIFFTDIHLTDEFEVIQIPTISSKDQYSDFVVKKLAQYIKTSHVLIIQADGYVLDGSAWSDEFLKYDYIGAPWLYRDGRNVGNGGFSLRSAKLQTILAEDDFIEFIWPEDEAICRLYRPYLERKYGIVFAPEELAAGFAYELQIPQVSTFGFHGNHHNSYRPQVFLRRSGAMGDIIMIEPVMAWFHDHGYDVVLDCPIPFYTLFSRHYYPVYHVNQVHRQKSAKTIDLDMAYEVRPKQLALLSYFQMCGVEAPVLRNPRLSVNAEHKLFSKYAVLHVDDTAMPHRNARGIEWRAVADYLGSMGYVVLQVGRGPDRGGLRINTSSEFMLMYVIAGADLFIGIDSGCAQIAVATGVKSVLIFGSVNPKFRYFDFTNIEILQKPCPIEHDGCYHEVVGTVGQDCAVERLSPPCTQHNHADVMSAVHKLLTR